MITTLKSLQDKFVNDPIFANQFRVDAAQVGVTFDIPEYTELGDGTDEVSLTKRRNLVEAYGSNLLTIYYRALQKFLQTNHKRYPLYVRVPFNESTFKINTETRVINIPKEFTANGVGVVGDHLAEFLWFEIDRFFDVTDLMTCDIDITWHSTVNGMSDAYDAIPFAKYCDNEKIYFGWYITQNASLVAGQIEFAIRFYKNVTENGSTYTEFSLYTQPAKLTIKPGMVLTAGTVREEYEDVVKSRAIYSEIINSLDASEPILDPTIVRGEYDLDVEVTNKPGLYKVFTIGAISPDNAGTTATTRKAAIEFKWYWNNILIDAQYNSVYNNAPLLIEEADMKIETTGPDANGKYQSVLTTNIPGHYRAYVGNRITDQTSPNYNAIRYVQTNTADIVEATQIKLLDAPSLPPLFYIGTTALSGADALKFAINYETVNGDAEYHWVRQHNDQTYDNGWISTNQEDMPIISLIPSEPGTYYAEARNICNNMQTVANTKNVIVINTPQSLDGKITVRKNVENPHNITVSIQDIIYYNKYKFDVYLISLAKDTMGNTMHIIDSDIKEGSALVDGYAFRLEDIFARQNIELPAPGNYSLSVVIEEITGDYEGLDSSYKRIGADASGACGIVFPEDDDKAHLSAPEETTPEEP